MEITNTEVVKIITQPQEDFKFLPANRITKDAHVRSLMGAFLRGEWIPPIFVTKDGYVVDGQNRYKAFCNICKQNPNANIALKVLTINTKEDPVTLAIRFNTGQKRWSADDYFHAYITLKVPSYIRLAKFLAKYKEIKGVRAALQLIKGSYATKAFQSGTLTVTPLEIKDAAWKMKYLNIIYQIIKDPRIYCGDTIVAFYNIYPETIHWEKFCNNLKHNFHAPLTQKCSDWMAAYHKCL